MRKLFYNWRYYGLGEKEYRSSQQITFANNLPALRQMNIAIFFIAVCFMFFPFVIEKSFIKGLYYLITAVISVIMYIIVKNISNKYDNGKNINNKIIYGLIIFYFVNITLFGLYLGVLSKPDSTASIYLVILIAALFLFTISPVFHFLLEIGSASFFIIACILVKTHEVWEFDVANAVITTVMGLFIGWYIFKHKMTHASLAKKLEDERNNYFNQSIVDELTQLKNRRDFIQTFQRFLTHYRPTDKYLCIAIMDIDYFKNFNDHYGHSMGDECLMTIGKTLRFFQESMGIYSARVGGEEFALLWFEEDTDNVNNIANHIKNVICELNIPHEKSSIAPHVTVSIGIHIVKCGVTENTQELYNFADKALYTAKRTGRNRAHISLHK